MLEAKDSDYTVKELATLLQLNPHEVSRLAKAGRVHGHYTISGRFHRFRRSEILFRRATGQDILK